MVEYEYRCYHCLNVIFIVGYCWSCGRYNRAWEGHTLENRPPRSYVSQSVAMAASYQQPPATHSIIQAYIPGYGPVQTDRQLLPQTVVYLPPAPPLLSNPRLLETIPESDDRDSQLEAGVSAMSVTATRNADVASQGALVLTTSANIPTDPSVRSQVTEPSITGISRRGTGLGGRGGQRGGRGRGGSRKAPPLVPSYVSEIRYGRESTFVGPASTQLLPPTGKPESSNGAMQQVVGYAAAAEAPVTAGSSSQVSQAGGPANFMRAGLAVQKGIPRLPDPPCSPTNPDVWPFDYMNFWDNEAYSVQVKEWPAICQRPMNNGQPCGGAHPTNIHDIHTMFLSIWVMKQVERVVGQPFNCTYENCTPEQFGYNHDSHDHGKGMWRDLPACAWHLIEEIDPSLMEFVILMPDWSQWRPASIGYYAPDHYSLDGPWVELPLPDDVPKLLYGVIKRQDIRYPEYRGSFLQGAVSVTRSMMERRQRGRVGLVVLPSRQQRRSLLA